MFIYVIFLSFTYMYFIHILKWYIDYKYNLIEKKIELIV